MKAALPIISAASYFFTFAFCLFTFAFPKSRATAFDFSALQVNLARREPPLRFNLRRHTRQQRRRPKRRRAALRRGRAAAASRADIHLSAAVGAARGRARRR